MICPTCKQEKDINLMRIDYNKDGKIITQCAVCWGLPLELEPIFLSAGLAIEKGADEIHKLLF